MKHSGAGTTLICFALAEEARPFQRRLQTAWNVETLLLGIGPRNAGRAFRDWLGKHQPPVRVFTCGYAGALDPGLDIGDVVCFSENDSALAAHLVAAGAREVRFHCADRVATTAAEKRALRQETGADAVEMESGVIHALCREAHLPCTTVRVISDLASEDLPFDFNQFARPDQSLDMPKLLLAIAKSPARIPRLLRLQRHCRLAATRLADTLETVLGRSLPPVRH